MAPNTDTPFPDDLLPPPRRSSALARAASPLALALATIAGCGGGTAAPTTDGGTMNTGCLTGQVSFDGLCVLPPSMEATRTQCGDVTEYCDKSNRSGPVIACLTDAPRMHPATPATVTLTGFIHPFSGGNSNAPVNVAVYKESDLAAGADLAKVTPIAQKDFNFEPQSATDATQFRACDTDATVGCVPTDPSLCKVPVCNDGLAGRKDDGNYCKISNGMGVCSPRLRWERRYSFDNIPTNTPLVIAATGQGGTPSSVWNSLLAWNTFLASDDKSCGGDSQATDCLDTTDMAHPKYQLNVSVISQADYMNVPTTAGLAGGISAGQGAVAGEIHDCDNVRIGNVQVAVKPAGDRLTYFNGNPFKTLPDSSRASIGTDRLGLYASLNVNPGVTTIEAVGLVGGKLTNLGRYKAWVYAGAVTVVNLNSGKPVQK